MNQRIVLIIIAALPASTAYAQPPGQHGPGGGGRSNAVLAAIDANGDHEITTDEMKKAFVALKKLDTNSDGKLERSEIHPEMAEGRDGQRGPREGADRQGRRANGQRANGQRNRGEARGGPGGGERGGPGAGRPDPAQMIEHAFEFDANQDGQLSRIELQAFAKSLGERGGRGGERNDGQRRGPGGRSGGRDRPDRPARPE